jgi:catalase
MTEHAKPTTTDVGIPVASDEHSLTVGPDGPILGELATIRYGVNSG